MHSIHETLESLVQQRETYVLYVNVMLEQPALRHACCSPAFARRSPLSHVVWVFGYIPIKMISHSQVDFDLAMIQSKTSSVGKSTKYNYLRGRFALLSLRYNIHHMFLVPAMCGAHLPHCEVHSCAVTLHGAYLAVLQSVPPSLWRGPCRQWELHFVSWGMTVLRVGLKRVELHVQRRSKPTSDP